MRDARGYRVPPCTYLGLPWPVWGWTDRLLAQAVAEHDRRLCPCGCGQWADDALDPDRVWVVEAATCTAGEALASARDSYGEKGPPAGTLLRLRDGGKSVSANPFADATPVWVEVDGPPAAAQHNSDDE